MVKLGMQKKTGLRVAIKIMNKSDMATKDLDQIRTEIEILKFCNHPNIIKLFDVFENKEYMYISKNSFIISSNGVLLWRRPFLLPGMQRLRATREESCSDYATVMHSRILSSLLRYNTQRP